MSEQHGWPMVRLGDVCTLPYGKALKSVDRDGGQFPVFGSGGQVGSHSETNFEGPTIILGRKGSAGAVFWSESPCWIIDTAFGIDSDPSKTDKRWLYWTLRFLDLGRLQKHAAVPGISRNDVLQEKIPLPPLEEQQRIAEILDAVESQITRSDKILTHCDEAHAELICQFLENNPTEFLPLKYCIESIESGKSPKCEAFPAKTDEWGVLKLSAVTTGRFLEEENKALPTPPDDVSRREVKPGDVLMTRKNTPELVGAVSLVENVRPKLMFPDLVFRINLSPDRLLPRYFQAVMMSPKYRNKVRSLAGGSAKSMSNISQGKLRELEIPVPSLEIQSLFSESSQQIDRVRSTANRQLALLYELHRSLQTRAFQGLLS